MERPSRYLGGEWNSPEIEPGGVSLALAYPDIYEIGMSNLGLNILLEVVNDMPGASAERVYSPWGDMEREMRAAGVPLFTLETHRPVGLMDVFGISIPHELTYTNILNLLDLSGLPLLSAERRDGPLVVGGGCGTANPEPLARFFDLFVLGEGEVALRSLVEMVALAKREGWTRDRLLGAACGLPGFYRPDRYTVDYRGDGTIESVNSREGAPARVSKNLVDLNHWCYPRRPVVPFCEAVHDRVNVELFRGCTRGCRFCQAGMVYRPVRERKPGTVVSMVEEQAAATGHEEASLCSLSSTDYTCFEQVASRVSDLCAQRRMALSLPSLRLDGTSVETALKANRFSRGGLTFAPEAGTQRLRDVINKPISEREMVDAICTAVEEGRGRFKLYFMIGLPTETMEDVEAIADLVKRIRYSVKKRGLAPPSLNVSVSTFVPQPHTPFQWAAMDSMEVTEEKQNLLKRELRGRGLKLSWHDREMTFVEGVLARGDRRLSEVVEKAWSLGARFDSWSEHHDRGLWLRALGECGVDPGFYTERERGPDEVFPWDHLDFGLDREFLREEYEKALGGETTGDCREGECVDCGVCSDLEVELELAGEW